MGAKPDWLQYIDWSDTFRLSDLLADRSLVPDWKGFYGFGLDASAAFRPGRVLYIGKTWDRGGFRARFGFYLRSDPTVLSRKPHSAALFLQDHYLRKDPPERIYVRFAPFEGDRELVLMLETAMMQYYEAWYNKSGMRAHTPFDTF